ncbi:MAG TPA: matrixin family metalloprotease [Bryobacteraceae bacterium]|jgi:uncharacterized protein (TIGR03437 family)|nr:matrixin family metalloprotease [Bryobacteraceae bacterium]
MTASIRRAAPLALLLTTSSFAYIRFTTNDATPVPLHRVDNAAIQFYINSGVTAGATSSASGKAVTVVSAKSDPQGAVRAALTAWNNVGTANVVFSPLKTTDVGHATDGKMVITIGTADDLSAINGALAITAIISASSSGTDPVDSTLTVDNGSIIDSDILLNPAINFSTDGSTPYDLQAVLTHEFGHSLGANHTGLLGATMFQFNTVSQRFLSADDLAFVNSAYPGTNNPVALGTISGTITTTAAAPVPYALLTFIDTAQGLSLGGLADATGKYSVNVPPGKYLVYAEPFNQIVQPGNLYFTTAQAALTVTFQPTLGPTSLAVSANNTATANITVTGGQSAVPIPAYGFGGAGGTNDIKSIFSIDGPIQIASGQTVDLAFAGTGFTSALTTSNIQVYGEGITVTAVHTDLATAGAFPIIRATLKIAAQTQPSLGSIFITSAGSTLALTGVLVIGPPTPSTVSANVISAASNIVGNGTVSPGEYVSLYGTGVAPATGPFAGIGYTNTGYIMGYLPANLGGVSVTFDGFPAPIFFDGVGNQINLQVPFEVAGKTSTQVVVSYFGSTSTAITLPVVPMHPALFTFPAAPAAYAANVAADGSVSTNLVTNPAARGSLIIVVGTGIGLPSYQAPGTANPILTGAPAPVPPTANLNANGWTCKIGGIDAPVAYAAWFNGFTAEAEWYVTVPATLAATGAVPIQFTSSTGATTQSNLTVYLK